MPQNQSDVIILKPTSSFLSFLSAHFPDAILPDKATLHRDLTAYTLPQQVSEEGTLMEIERHFLRMFQHEARRVLGTQATHDIDVTFLDFLCCFKFELHSNVVLMESSVSEGQHLLCVKPRSVLLTWIKSTLDDTDDLAPVLDKVNLAHLTDNATVLIKNFENHVDVSAFVRRYYRPLFKAEMFRLFDHVEHWPDVDSFPAFNRYFSVEVHTHLVHLHA